MRVIENLNKLSTKKNNTIKESIIKTLRCIPLRENNKIPLIKEWQKYIEKPKLNIPINNNYGILCGQKINNYYFYCLDVDIEKLKKLLYLLDNVKDEIQAEVLRLIKIDFDNLHKIAIVKTASGGYHIYFYSYEKLKTIVETTIYQNELIGNVKIGLFSIGKQIVGIGSIINYKQYNCIEYNPKPIINNYNDIKGTLELLNKNSYKNTANNTNNNNSKIIANKIIVNNVNTNTLTKEILQTFKKEFKLIKRNSNIPLLKICFNLIANGLITKEKTINENTQIFYTIANNCNVNSELFTESKINIYKRLMNIIENALKKDLVQQEFTKIDNAININKQYFTEIDCIDSINKYIATILIGTTGTGKSSVCYEIINNEKYISYEKVYISNLRKLVNKNGIELLKIDSYTLKSFYKFTIEKDRKYIIILDEFKTIINCLMGKNNILNRQEQINILEIFYSLIELYKSGFIRDIKFICLDIHYQISFYLFFKMINCDFKVIKNDYIKTNQKELIPLKTDESLFTSILNIDESTAIFCGKKTDSIFFKNILGFFIKNLPIYLINADTNELPDNIDNEKCIIIFTGAINEGFSIISNHIETIYIVDNNNKLDTQHIHNSMFRIRDNKQHGIKKIYYYNKTSIQKRFTFTKQKRDEILKYDSLLNKISKYNYYELYNQLEKEQFNNNIFRQSTLKKYLHNENIKYLQPININDEKVKEGIKQAKQKHKLVKKVETINNIFNPEQELNKDNVTETEIYKIVKAYGNDKELMKMEFDKVINNKRSDKYFKNEAKKSYILDTINKTDNELIENGFNTKQIAIRKLVIDLFKYLNIDINTNKDNWHLETIQNNLNKKIFVKSVLDFFNQQHIILLYEAIYNIPTNNNPITIHQITNLLRESGLPLKRHRSNGKRKDYYYIDSKYLDKLYQMYKNRKIYKIHTLETKKIIKNIRVSLLFIYNYTKIVALLDKYKTEQEKSYNTLYILAKMYYTSRLKIA